MIQLKYFVTLICDRGPVTSVEVEMKGKILQLGLSHGVVPGGRFVAPGSLEWTSLSLMLVSRL